LRWGTRRTAKRSRGGKKWWAPEKKNAGKKGANVRLDQKKEKVGLKRAGKRQGNEGRTRNCPTGWKIRMSRVGTNGKEAGERSKLTRKSPIGQDKSVLKGLIQGRLLGGNPT